MSLEPDRIELAVVVQAAHDAVWAFVSEPGWFVNDGELAEHVVEWEGEVAEVSDPDHGTFEFTLVERDEPRSVVYESTDSGGATRRVSFEVEGVDDGTLVRVVESGFARGSGSFAHRLDQHRQNTRTWLQQLDLARERLEQ